MGTIDTPRRVAPPLSRGDSRQDFSGSPLERGARRAGCVEDVGASLPHPEPRHGPCLPQKFQGPLLRGPHPAFLGRWPVIIAGQMQPTVHEIERQLGGEVAAVGLGIGQGGVGGDADFPGEPRGRVARESNHVGRPRIAHEVAVDPGQRHGGEKHQGQFSRRATASESRRLDVEDGEGGRDGPAINAQPRVTVADGKLALHAPGPMGSADLACS